jgi:hypothetical protein
VILTAIEMILPGDYITRDGGTVRKRRIDDGTFHVYNISSKRLELGDQYEWEVHKKPSRASKIMNLVHQLEASAREFQGPDGFWSVKHDDGIRDQIRALLEVSD